MFVLTCSREMAVEVLLIEESQISVKYKHWKKLNYHEMRV